MKAVALIDGEHAPDVVREALRELPYEWVGAILAGGTEKLREGQGYGVPLVEGFTGAEALVDLSDAPVTTATLAMPIRQPDSPIALTLV